MLLRASQAWAWLAGRQFLTPDEVKAVAKPCLRHRIIVRPELQLEGATPDGVLDQILAMVPTPR
jgi:MoxR-like ATPase